MRQCCHYWPGCSLLKQFWYGKDLIKLSCECDNPLKKPHFCIKCQILFIHIVSTFMENVKSVKPWWSRRLSMIIIYVIGETLPLTTATFLCCCWLIFVVLLMLCWVLRTQLRNHPPPHNIQHLCMCKNTIIFTLLIWVHIGKIFYLGPHAWK